MTMAFDETKASHETKAFDGVAVLEMSANQMGATVGQFFADYGADVIMVEPPGGSPLRQQAAYPYWARGKRSVTLDAKNHGDLAALLELGSGADVFIETFRPGVATRMGLGYERLSTLNPALVYVSITGFGDRSPYSGVRAYEAVVQAKVGSLHMSAGLTPRAGPAFVAAPYCTSSAAQMAIHAAVTALIERLSSGRGQHVQTNMAQALGAHDTWNAMVAHVAKQYPDAFQSLPPVDDNGVPIAGILFRLMTGVSADGRWLQFSQTAPRLFEAFLRAVDLDWMLTDPEWDTVPEFDDAAKRREFWELLLTRIQSKTVPEWAEVFDEEPDVWAEVFRRGPEVLDHPQLVYDRSGIEIVDPERGAVRQLTRLVGVSDEPAMEMRPAPRLDEHPGRIQWAGPDRAGTGQAATGQPDQGKLRTGKPGQGELARSHSATAAGRPLAGILVLELGTQYAAPFGATLLTDLGARVIKIEQRDGDQIRWMTPFPDLSGVKVLQGKESFAVDITRPEGLALVHELVQKADVVLQSFRAGVAKRRGLDAETLQAINPDLIYVSSPAYGDSGPCGRRPAYAPTIGAAVGLPWRNLGGSVPEGPGLDLEVVKAASMRVRAGTTCRHTLTDSPLSVSRPRCSWASTSRERGLGRDRLNTSMLLTTASAIADGIVDWEGRPETPMADRELLGLDALYRLYQTASGWVVLAAPTEKEWQALAAALSEYAPSVTDPRFATARDRHAHDAESPRNWSRSCESARHKNGRTTCFPWT